MSVNICPIFDEMTCSGAEQLWRDRDGGEHARKGLASRQRPPKSGGWTSQKGCSGSGEEESPCKRLESCQIEGALLKAGDSAEQSLTKNSTPVENAPTKNEEGQKAGGHPRKEGQETRGGAEYMTRLFSRRKLTTVCTQTRENKGGEGR